MMCSKQVMRDERRAEALVAAEACVALLKERFGARRVILFGSLVGDGLWHESSDLDLAVEGLSSHALWEAEGQLRAIVPAWLEVDLVPLERVHPQVRARILGERTMPEEPYLALKARLEDELNGLGRVAKDLTSALKRAGETPDEYDVRALATYLDDFYTGCERLCERVAVALDGGLPQGEHWHQLLLGQMGEPGGQERPPLFGGRLLLQLDEYRRFRHRVRHLYGYELDAERVLALAQAVQPTLGQVETAVTVFGGWLQTQAERKTGGEKGNQTQPATTE